MGIQNIRKHLQESGMQSASTSVSAMHAWSVGPPRTVSHAGDLSVRKSRAELINSSVVPSAACMLREVKPE